MDESSISGLSSLTIFVVLLVVNHLITLAHNALMNAQKSTLLTLQDQGKKSARIAFNLADDASRLLVNYQLSMILLRFFGAGVLAIGIAPHFAQSLAELGMLPFSAFVLAEVIVMLLGAAVMLALGVQVPATIGAAKADQLALWFARPMQLLVHVLQPFSWVTQRISEGIVRLLGIQAHVHYVTEEEIKTLVDAGQEEGVIEDQEKEMIYSIFQLASTSVREVMVPRLDMVGLRSDAPLDEAVQTVLAAGHSRIPVYMENIDHICGLLYAKDLLRLWGSGDNGDAMKDLLREVYFVPEGKAAMDLLREMQARRVHLAIVVDEYGGTAGLVTLEDLIEEIIGEVQDEYDFNEQESYTKVSDNEYICSALLDLDDLNYLLGVDLPTDETDTLGGFIYTEIGEVPTPGTVIETEQVRLEVLSVDQRRIGQVRVTRLNREPELDEQTSGDS